jgi:ACT domain-containing protein
VVIICEARTIIPLVRYIDSMNPVDDYLVPTIPANKYSIEGRIKNLNNSLEILSDGLNVLSNRISSIRKTIEEEVYMPDFDSDQVDMEYSSINQQIQNLNDKVMKMAYITKNICRSIDL